MHAIPTFKDIQQAHSRIKRFVHRTQILTSESIDDIIGAHVYFKCENFQKVGAFKYRGATNAILTLIEKEPVKGVATHSSGNHAAALALAARKNGINCYVAMPHTAPKTKIEAVRNYGAEITFCEPTLQSREETIAIILEKTGAVFIHPFDDFQVISGQGTVAKEFLEDEPRLNILLAPVGGGGLLSGSVIAAKSINPEIKVFGCEPANANDAYRSFKAGKIFPSINPKTIADGLLTSLSDLTYEIIHSMVDDIFIVSEESILFAMRLIWERMKIIIEPSSAVAMAVLIENRKLFSGTNVGIILSGGNVDLSNLPFHGL
jgi:threonine dehydratase